MRFRPLVLFVALTGLALPAAAGYGTASELLDAMRDAERKRAEGVSDYAMDVTWMDHPVTQYYERTRGGTAENERLGEFRIVPHAEARERLEGAPGISSADLAALEKMTRGLVGAPNGTHSGLARRTADTDHAAAIAERAEIVGRESLEGRDTYVVRADGLNLPQHADGSEFVIRSVTLWIDAKDLLALKTRMDGEVTQKGETRAMYIEKHDLDPRTVPGSRLILPYRSVLRMGGMLGPEEQREMEKARQGLADLDRQMASMPPDQRAMAESMMGPRIETMRKMVEGGEFEIETIVRDVRINPGLSGAFSGVGATAPTRAGIGALVERSTAAARHAQDREAIRRDREACLERKVEEAQAAKRKKKRFGAFLGAVGRIAGRHATGGLAEDVRRVSGDLYEAQATTQDLETAAEALGITPDDIAACENPGRER